MSVPGGGPFKPVRSLLSYSGNKRVNVGSYRGWKCLGQASALSYTYRTPASGGCVVVAELIQRGLRLSDPRAAAEEAARAAGPAPEWLQFLSPTQKVRVAYI